MASASNSGGGQQGPGEPPEGSSGAQGGSSTSGEGAASSASALTAAVLGGGSEGGASSLGSLGGAAAAAAAAAAMFPEEMDDSDVSRLQAMLEARGFPPHLAGVLGPRMHHLILNRAMAPSTTGKAQQLLQGLQAAGDESRQLQAVIEMCQLLVMGNEDTLAGFPIRQVVPALVTLLKMEHNFDLMNHACRALTYMMEALPRSASVIVDAVPTFLETPQAIHCIDVAEQSLSALEMLSKKHAKSILHAGGVAACLTYLDFFSIAAQRNALAISSNCCHGLLPEEFVHVQDSLATLSSRLVHDDKRSSETACQALSRLAESFKNDRGRLKDLARPDVLENLQRLLSAPPQQSQSSTFVAVLHVLVVMSSHGSDVGPLLLEGGIGATLRRLLVTQVSASPGAAASSSTTSSTTPDEGIELVQRNPAELYEITSLLAEMMPPLPADGIFAVDALLVKPGAYVRDPVLWQWQDDRGNWHTYGYNDCRLVEAAFVAGDGEATLRPPAAGKSFAINLRSMHEIREESGTARPVRRVLTSQLQQEQQPQLPADTEAEEKKRRHLELTAKLTRDLMPVLLEVYSTSAGPGVRHSCIQAFLRMVYHSEEALLLDVLKVTAVSSQIAGMLSSGDLRVVVGAMQLSELLLQKMPEEFGVHFRREGVLHQVQRLIDPDNPICVAHFSESPTASAGMAGSASVSWQSAAAMAGSTSSSAGPSGRSWTVAGSSLANMFPEQLRVPKRRDESSPDGSTGAMAASAVPEGEASAAASGSAAASVASSSGQGQPMRLSDMLKRKRVSKRTSGRKGRHSESGTAPVDMATASPSSSSSASTPFDMSPGGPYGSPPSGSDTPSRRSRLADRTSSLLSQLHPSKWVRSSAANPGSHGHRGKDFTEAAAAAAAHRGLAVNPAAAAATAAAHGREKAKRWVREQAARFLESYFKESLGSRHPALTILRRLSAQVDHLTRKPKDGERCLREILSVILENDISPFEVTQSGLVRSLLAYLTKPQLEGHEEVSREGRVRTFLHVFLGCPKTDQEENAQLDPEVAPKFLAFAQKMNACVNHLEQFPVRTHDMMAGGAAAGVRSAGSALRFFRTHHLKCSLQRHPDCSSLKSWKGGLVKIDPLALVQAIERYLISRGYGSPTDGSGSGGRDSGGSEDEDDDMSDDGGDDDHTLAAGGHSSSSPRGPGRMSAFDEPTAGSSSSSGGGGLAFGGASSAAGSSAMTSFSSLSGGHRLEFLIGDHVLPYDMTVYQAVQQFGSAPAIDPVSDSDGEGRAPAAAAMAAAAAGGSLYGSPGVWAKIHTIYYRPAASSATNHSQEPSTSASSASCKSGGGKKGKGLSKGSRRKSPPDELWSDGVVPEVANPLDEYLTDKLPSARLSDSSAEVLSLMRVLYALNRNWGKAYHTVAYFYPVIGPAEFVNAKLTAKVNRQLQDPIIIMTSNLPSWLRDLAVSCPFLLPFETRQLLFHATSFDRDRALLRLLDSAPELAAADGTAGQERVAPDLDRKKRVISRENLLKQSEVIMAELASSKSLLEIQYENEVGTGLGPTLEFYTLVSRELQRADLGLWKGDAVKISSDADGGDGGMDSDESEATVDDPECGAEYVHSATGLYPSPLARASKNAQRQRLKAKFNFIGRLMAKAVMDGRMLDLPFGRPFYQWLLRGEMAFVSCDLLDVDPTVAGTITQLETIARKKMKMDESSGAVLPEELTMDGCPGGGLGLGLHLAGISQR